MIKQGNNPLTGLIASEPGWADTGLWGGRHARSARLWKLLWMLILPPRGHRTMPTLTGILLVIVSIGFGSAAYNNNSNILFMTFSLLIAVMVLSLVLALLNFRRVRWRLAHIPRLREGEKAAVVLELHNGKRLLPSYALALRTRMGTTLTAGEERGSGFRIFRRKRKPKAEDTLLPLDGAVGPDQRQTLDWLITPPQRGLLPLTVESLESSYPFSFFSKAAGEAQTVEAPVWPGRVRYTFRPPGGRRQGRAGDSRRKPGGGPELIGLRDYKPGDSQKGVHWKASAKVGKLMVKETAEEQLDGYVLHIETDAQLWGAAGPRFETLCRLVASLAEDLHHQGRLLAISVDAEPVRPIRSLHDLHGFFDQLAVLTPTGQPVNPEQREDGRVLRFRPSGEGINIILRGVAVGENLDESKEADA
jgi:uncharacterized protein (DUF58 family)